MTTMKTMRFLQHCGLRLAAGWGTLLASGAALAVNDLPGGPKVNQFDLHDPVIDQVADIVRAADTGELGQSREAPGLLAISLGLSANVRDDIVLLEQAMPVYDALYAWCKTARNETHSWPQKVATQ